MPAFLQTNSQIRSAATFVDRVSPEARAAEREIDGLYRSNPLLGRHFAEAAWSFLAHLEELHIRDNVQEPAGGIHRLALLVDDVVNNAKWPLRWLKHGCQPGGIIPRSFSEDNYDAAWRLYDLSEEYSNFETAFTYATAGCIELNLDGTRLVASGELRADTRYEAYDRLMRPAEGTLNADVGDVLLRIDESVQVSGDTFRYALNPQLVARVMDVLSGLRSNSIVLPSDWHFPRYSAADLAQVGNALQAMALIHFRARLQAMALGCIGLGYLNALLAMQNDELLARVRRYSGVQLPIAAAILEDLTYGARDVRNADPALQPLIQLTPNQIIIPPNLVIGSNFRRNLAVLLNRMPLEKAVYSRLNEQRSALCAGRVSESALRLGFRTWAGSCPGRSDLPDVDMALISDVEKHCLFLELKAFVEPAEVREILDRDQEIAKGVQQAEKLRAEFASDASILRRALAVDEDYTATFVVGSEWGIGSCWVQSDSIPVIRVEHLLRRIEEDGLLIPVCNWLCKREYLPVNGVHYEEIPVLFRVGRWELEWYGIKPLVD